jgi:hypothetical protein
MDITIYRRHAKDCTQQQDRYAPRCGCPLWAQYQFRGSQGKKSLKTRIWSEAQQLAGKLEQNLENLRLGKSASNDVTVGQAANEWLEFRSKNGLTNTKPKLMCGKLVAWCEANGILMLPAFTAQAAIKFRMSLPFRTGDSSSLAVHWSVIGGFFNWCAGMGQKRSSAADAQASGQSPHDGGRTCESFGDADARDGHGARGRAEVRPCGFGGRHSHPGQPHQDPRAVPRPHQLSFEAPA